MKKIKALVVKLNKKTIAAMAVVFLVVNVALQLLFFKDLFLNENPNGDENGYRFLIAGIKEFSWQAFSNTNAQPFAFIGYLFNQIFHDAQFTVRFVSLLSCICSFLFVYLYYVRCKFTDFIEGSKRLSRLVVFAILFAVYFILSCQYIGSSDAFSVAFGIPAFLLLTEVLFYHRKHSLIIIGLLLAISFTSRPTVLIILFSYLVCLLLFFRNLLLSKKLIGAGVYFVVFTAFINIVPLVQNGKIILDIKEISKESGTSWFELNYLMAKKWDSGEVPNTQWLTESDVRKYKQEHPDFAYPKNLLDIVVNEPGLFFRQMMRMGALSMYSSFRYLYFLFPFLIFYFCIRKKNKAQGDIKKAYFIVSFYFLSLLIFMATALKLMEFRWMFLLLVFYAFYALDLSKGISLQKRMLLLNSIFVMGTLFFILKMLK